MTLNEEFMKVLSAEIKEKNLLVLHKYSSFQVLKK